MELDSGELQAEMDSWYMLKRLLGNMYLIELM